MTKRSILFIVQSKSNAGTNSSLSGIYNLMKNDYDFKVLSLKNQGEGTYEFLTAAISLPLISAYFSDFAELNGNEKIFGIVVKLLKKLSALLGVNLHQGMLRRCVRRFEKSRHYDLIVGFQEGYATYVASLFSNPDKIAWVHSDLFRDGAPLYTNIIDYSKFRNIVCVSKYTRNRFADHYPDLNERILYIYNIIDTKRILDCSLLPIDDARFVCDDFTIISAGRMDPVKQFSLIPGIAKQLVAKQLKFHWYIMGGPRNEEYERIRNAIHECGVENEVVLLGNVVNPYPYFRSSDLYVCTSFSEACPMVFIEARLCSIPIVSNCFGSAPEFIENDYDGLMDSNDNLHEVIERMITDKGLYSRIKYNSDNRKVDNDAIVAQIKMLFD